MFVTFLSVPINHEHRDSTLYLFNDAFTGCDYTKLLPNNEQDRIRKALVTTGQDAMWRNVLATADSNPGQFKCRPIFFSETEPGTSQVLRTICLKLQTSSGGNLPKQIFTEMSCYATYQLSTNLYEVSYQHTAINNVAISHSLQRSDVTWHPLYVNMDNVTTCVFVHFLWHFFPSVTVTVTWPLLLWQ